MFFRGFASIEGSRQVFSRAHSNHSCEVLIVSVHPRSVGTLLSIQKGRCLLFKNKYLQLSLSISNLDALKSKATISTGSSVSADSSCYLQKGIFMLFSSDGVPVLFFTIPRLSSEDEQWCINHKGRKWKDSRGYGQTYISLIHEPEHRWTQITLK